MRELEWKILFQMYAGYAAIGIAYEHLRSKNFAHQGLISSVSVGATAAFYLAARYLTYRIQERLIAFDGVRDRYFTLMHNLVGADEVPAPRLGRPYYWTYNTQVILSTLACLCLVGYQVSRGLSIAPPAIPATVLMGGALTAALRIGWHVNPREGR
jgi:hypothetical protein